MPTIQQLRDRAIELKIAKADNIADITDINRQIDGKRLHPDRFQQLNAERADLAADNTEIESELSQINARVLGAEQADRERVRKTDAVRTLVAALIVNGRHPGDCIVATAINLEAQIQASIPPVEIPDLPDTEDDH